MPITGAVSVYSLGVCGSYYRHQEEVMDLLREYQEEHPEECVELNRIKAHSQAVAESRKRMASEKLKRIEECRRILYGKE